MNNSFSGKGKAWEWRHSIWILWTLPFLAITSFIAFLYIGRRTKTIKWTIFGIIYLVWIIFMFIFQPMFPSNTFIGSLSNAFYTAGLLIWIWSIIHAFLVRKEYLTRLSYLIDHPEIREKSRNKYYNAVTSDYQQSSANTANQRVITMPQWDNTVQKPAQNPFQNPDTGINTNYVSQNAVNNASTKIDINKCSVDNLITLPGITIPLARKIVEKRNTEGEFKSVDEFLNFTMVKPHFAVQLRDIITVSAKTTETPKSDSKRNIDF